MAETTVHGGSSTNSSLRRRLFEFWYYFSENRGAVMGLRVFLPLVFVALFAPDRATWAERAISRCPALCRHSARRGGDCLPARHRCRRPGHALAPDPWRPLFVVHRRRRYRLALIGGIFLGLLAGYFRGWVDALIMRVMDIILAFPSLLLALVLVAILGPGLINAMLAIALVLQPHFVRLTRAAVIAERTVNMSSPPGSPGPGNSG